MSTRPLDVTVDDHVAHVRLNRPEKLNALDDRMLKALVEVGESFRGATEVRAVVLSGAGRAFCAGMDIDHLRRMADDGADPELTATGGRITHVAQRACWVWRELEVPVIAAVHGVAVGGGLQLALGADIRVAAAEARLGLLEVNWGLTPDMTGTVTLPSIVGVDVAKDLTFTGRIVGGEEALRIGLVTRLAMDPTAEAMALAAEIASKSRAAVVAAKALLNPDACNGLAEQLALERSTFATLAGTPEQHATAVAHFSRLR